VPMYGVSAQPAESSRMPAISTTRGPWRSAMAPASGWMAPQVNCPMASAKLMVAMPRPVVSLSGAMNNPCD